MILASVHQGLVSKSYESVFVHDIPHLHRFSRGRVPIVVDVSA